MKDIWEIYKQDFKKIFTNWAALIVLITLCFIPSLYAWFNIRSCWDPYSPQATKNIKVAVVNDDKGVMYNDQNINIGDEIVTELKQNDALGWKFVNLQEANNLLEDEAVYATIVIPDNFSSNIMSFTSDDIKKGNIIYTVNEKINAIAPKITNKGAETIQQNVSNIIVNTISEKIFSVLKTLGIDINENLPKLETLFDKLTSLQNNFANINNLVNKGSNEVNNIKILLVAMKQDLSKVNNILNQGENITTDISQFINASQSVINNITPVINQDLILIGGYASQTSDKINDVINVIHNEVENAPDKIDQLISFNNNLKGTLDSVIKFLTRINSIRPQESVTNFINDLKAIQAKVGQLNDALNNVKNDILAGKTIDTSKLEELKTITQEISSKANDLQIVFNNDVQPSIINILSQALNISNESQNVLVNVSQKIPLINTIIDNGIDLINQNGDIVTYLQTKLPILEQHIDDLINKKNSIDFEQIKKILTLISHNVEQRASFLSKPINLEQNSIFNMGNYGTSMTPFYTVLSLWVGAILLVSILKTNASKKYGAIKNYFGKIFLFVGIGIIQSLIVSAGDIYLLGVEAKHPELFIGLMCLVAIIFNIIVYSLVSVFGNVGKVMAIVLLVLQLAAGGGTFPVELMSSFFQTISPYLPFTYAIGLAREAIGGIAHNILVNDLSFLIIYAVLIFIAALLLKGPVNKLAIPFNKKFAESGLSTESEKDE